YFVNITCSVAILRPNLSHTPPASDRLLSLLPPCGPTPVLTGGDEASAGAPTPLAAALRALRGSERGASFGFDHQFLDLGAEPRVHVIRDGLQYSRLLCGDNLPESLDYLGFDSLRVLGG